jgi:hypothetical protein
LDPAKKAAAKDPPKSERNINSADSKSRCDKLVKSTQVFPAPLKYRVMTANNIAIITPIIESAKTFWLASVPGLRLDRIHDGKDRSPNCSLGTVGENFIIFPIWLRKAKTAIPWVRSIKTESLKFRFFILKKNSMEAPPIENSFRYVAHAKSKIPNT